MKRTVLAGILFITHQAFANNNTCGAFFCIGESAPLPQTEQPDSVSHKLRHHIAFDLRPDYILPTNNYQRGSGGVVPPSVTLAANLKYGFRFAPDSYFGRNYPHTVQGIGVGYHTFFNPSEMGNPLAIYVFQTSRIATISHRLSLDYEWNFGVSLGWKKYDPVKNPTNTAVGSFANAYINLGLLLNWQLSSHTHFRLGAGFTHFSNGNTRYPNAGINTAGAYLGISQELGNDKSYGTTLLPPDQEWKNKSFRERMTYDVVLYGAVRKKGILPDGVTPVIAPGVFAVGGVNFTPLYRVNRYFRTGISLDVQYDESANIVNHIANPDGATAGFEAKFYKPPFREQFGVGLSARAELVMPIFSINIGIGKNLICKGADTNASYQILALKTDITRRFFLHVGYQLYRFKDPNNLMIGIGYRFGRRTTKPESRHQSTPAPAKKIKNRVP